MSLRAVTAERSLGVRSGRPRSRCAATGELFAPITYSTLGQRRRLVTRSTRLQSRQILRQLRSWRDFLEPDVLALGDAARSVAPPSGYG